MELVLKSIFFLLPLLFGIGFLGPLFAQIIDMASWQPPFRMTPLAFGLTIGGFWGCYAVARGSWITWRP